MAQRFDVTPKFRSNREDFGAESKIFPAFPGRQGKSAPAGVDARRVFAPPPLTRRPPLFAKNSSDAGQHFFCHQHEGLMAERRAHQIVEPDLFA